MEYNLLLINNVVAFPEISMHIKAFMYCLGFGSKLG